MWSATLPRNAPTKCTRLYMMCHYVLFMANPWIFVSPHPHLQSGKKIQEVLVLSSFSVYIAQFKLLFHYSEKKIS